MTDYDVKTEIIPFIAIMQDFTENLLVSILWNKHQNKLGLRFCFLFNWKPQKSKKVFFWRQKPSSEEISQKFGLFANEWYDL